MLRNLASSLFLTERDEEDYGDNQPKVRGRVVTTLPKAKEVRPLVERCITLARRSLEHAERAEQFGTNAERGSSEWKKWRESEQWQNWANSRAPVVAARRRALQLLGDKQAVEILFGTVAPRFRDRDGGYTRVLKLAAPRLGDAGQRAIIEFVGVHDRVTVRSERPAFASDRDEDEGRQEDRPAEPANQAAPESAEGERSPE